MCDISDYGCWICGIPKPIKISGTSNIASNFLVKITSITPNSIIGTAADKTEITTYNDTSATFGVSLKSPGDSITYNCRK